MHPPNLLLENVPLSPLLLAIVGVTIGLLQAFFGYRLFRLTLGLVGFLLGAALVLSFAQAHWSPGATTWLATVFGGILGAVLVSALYLVGVFLAGAFLGVVIGQSLGTLVVPLFADLLTFALAIIGGVVAVKVQKLMIVLATAFGGAWIALVSFATWRHGELEPANWSDQWLLGALGAWLVLGLFGCAVQYGKDETAARKERAPRRRGAARQEESVHS